MRYTTQLLKVSAFALLVVLGGCTRKSSDTLTTTATSTIPFDAIRNCHRAGNPYPSQITNNILGTWQWEKSFNPWTQETTLASRHVLIHFNDAATYEITENGITVAQGVWSLEQLSGSEWTLKLSQKYAHTQGVVYLCNEELILASSFLDGPDNYFVRKSK